MNLDDVLLEDRGGQISSTTVPRGRAEQISTLPVAGGSTGSGAYATCPDSGPLSQW